MCVLQYFDGLVGFNGRTTERRRPSRETLGRFPLHTWWTYPDGRRPRSRKYQSGEPEEVEEDEDNNKDEEGVWKGTRRRTATLSGLQKISGLRGKTFLIGFTGRTGMLVGRGRDGDAPRTGGISWFIIDSLTVCDQDLFTCPSSD